MASRLGDRKGPETTAEDTLQDTRFDSHLTGVKKWRFYWLMKTLTHKKGFPRKWKQEGHFEKS